MNAAAPLGVFDSGLGGLTVVRALKRALPYENIVYLGDTARVPYGTRSAETVIRYARGCARVLTEANVKALIVACNTVSAVALDVLRAELDLPVVGVVEPGSRAALEVAHRLSREQARPVSIGVLGTAGTIASGAYPRTVHRLSTRVEVVGQPAPLLVPLIEEGWLEGEVPRLAARRYLEPLMNAGVGVVLLGCTHYPLLKTVIAEVSTSLASGPITVVDSALSTAEAVVELMQARRIQQNSSADPGTLRLLVTDMPGSFYESARRFLGNEIQGVEQIDLPT